MVDIILESIRALVLAVLLGWLWQTGRYSFSESRTGWNIILFGFSLLLFGSVLDITDNFEGLNWLVVVGDTDVESFLEKFVGFLGGFLTLAIGLSIWVPKVQKLSDEIEERKRVESELQNYKEHLEELVHLQTKDLQVAKDAAEQANRAKSLFFAKLSHELRTPMHGILALSHLGEEKSEQLSAEKVKEYFSNVHSSADRLMSLLNDLLDFSKLEAGKMSFDFRIHDINKIVTLSIKEIEPLLKKNKLTLKFTPSTAVTGVMLDFDKILQVLRNLFSNAVKFSPKGGTIKVVVYTRQPSSVEGDMDSAYTTVSVSDEGSGIPQAQLSRVFERFVQLDDSLSTTKGTGLGLAICKEIIDEHNGTISVVNNAIGGATFEFSLPLRGVETRQAP